MSKFSRKRAPHGVFPVDTFRTQGVYAGLGRVAHNMYNLLILAATILFTTLPSEASCILVMGGQGRTRPTITLWHT